ncbi:galactose-3-O-sulfotransferase 2-like [Mercenaria mercenaria]|uniref:galactose-3-O-sulfotransferase 2-like n=1 Tax=Mercenaria mercenaria TaxID=6596 RepID=UPI00234E5A2D|nr:galactose-3-O-sulfotransferase 2-like [Mercenaria mercenaria]
MGLHFYLKSLLAVFVMAVLVLFTWHKATEVIREVVDFQTQIAEGQGQGLKGKQNKAKSNAGAVQEMQQNAQYRSDMSITEETTEVEKEDTTVSTTTRSQPDVTVKDSLTTEVDSQDDHRKLDTSTTLLTTITATTDTTTKMSQTKTPSLTTATSTTKENSVTETNIQELERLSTEKRHVAYLKVHKTGSSTVQNIFLRFGDSRNLTFVLAHDNKHLAETKFPNMISYSNTLTDDNVVPPPEGRHFEILCCHVIYNRTQFEKYLPKDTAYIGLVREPISRLESSLRYFNMYPNVSLSEFAANPLHYDKGLHSMSNNRMSFEFGFPLNLFPNSKEKPENLQEAVDQYIEKLKNEFDLIMINENMDESLVLMKRILNWNIKDIMYMKQLVAKQETRRFSETDIKKLKSHLYLDFALYQAAKTEFDAKVKELGEDFREEVKKFKEDKEKVHSFCSNKETGILSFPKSKWNSAYNITSHDCSLYTKYEIKFIQDIRMRQYGRLGI